MRGTCGEEQLEASLERVFEATVSNLNIIQVDDDLHSAGQVQTAPRG